MIMKLFSEYLKNTKINLRRDQWKSQNRRKEELGKCFYSIDDQLKDLSQKRG